MYTLAQHTTISVHTVFVETSGRKRAAIQCVDLSKLCRIGFPSMYMMTSTTLSLNRELRSSNNKQNRPGLSRIRYNGSQASDIVYCIARLFRASSFGRTRFRSLISFIAEGWQKWRCRFCSCSLVKNVRAWKQVYAEICPSEHVDGTFQLSTAYTSPYLTSTTSC